MSFESEMKKRGLDASIEKLKFTKEYMKEVGIIQYLLELEDKRRRSEAIRAQNNQFVKKLKGLTQEELEALRLAVIIDPDKNPEKVTYLNQFVKKLKGLTQEELEELMSAIKKDPDKNPEEFIGGNNRGRR